MIKTKNNEYRTVKLNYDPTNNFKIGDYVFVSKYPDNDPCDPWCIGIIFEIGIDSKSGFIRVDSRQNKNENVNMRCWRNVKKLTKEQGKEILKWMK